MNTLFPLHHSRYFCLRCGFSVVLVEYIMKVVHSKIMFLSLCIPDIMNECANWSIKYIQHILYGIRLYWLGILGSRLNHSWYSEYCSAFFFQIITVFSINFHVKTVQLLEQQEWVSSGANNLLRDNIFQNPPCRTFYQQLKAFGVWVI